MSKYGMSKEHNDARIKFLEIVSRMTESGAKAGVLLFVEQDRRIAELAEALEGVRDGCLAMGWSTTKMDAALEKVRVKA